MTNLFRLFSIILFTLSFSVVLASTNPTGESLIWETQEGISYAEGVGFIKEYGSTWGLGIAVSSAYDASAGFCISLNSEEWPFSTAFKLGFSDEAETSITNTLPTIHFDLSSITINSITYSLYNINDLQIQVHPNGDILLYENQILITTVSGEPFPESLFVHLALENEEDLIPVDLITCQSNFSPPPPEQPCNSIQNEKYVEQLSYANDASLTSHTVTIKDNLGVPVHVMRKNLESNEVLSKQIVNDKFGKPVLETLEAPTGSTFCIDEGFIYPEDFQVNGNSVESYSWQDFDVNQNAPENVSEYSTLGNYYSGNQQDIAKSTLPFARKFNDNNVLQEVVSHAGYHERFFNLENRVFNFNTVSHTELDNVYGLRGSYILDDQMQTVGSNNLYAKKQISISHENEAMITYSNLKGQLLATALSGVASNACAEQDNKLELRSGIATTIHVPLSKINGLALKFPDPQNNYENSPSYPTEAFDLVIFDRLTNTLLTEGTDFNLNQDANNAALQHIELLGERANRSNILRITCRPNSLAQTIWWEFLTYLDINLRTYVHYKTDYSNWAMTYYDKEGNLVKAIQPEGIDCSINAYDGNVASKKMYYYRTLDNPSSTTIFKLKTNPQQGYTDKFRLMFKPYWLFEYFPDQPREQFPTNSNTTVAGKAYTLSLPNLSVPSPETLLSEKRFSSSVPDPKNPFVTGAPYTLIPEGAKHVTYTKATKFKMTVQGANSGSVVPLKQWEYRITEHQTIYFVEDIDDQGHGYLRKLDVVASETEYEKRELIPTSTNTWTKILYHSYKDDNNEIVHGTAFMFDDWDDNSISFKAFDEIRIRISDPKRQDLRYVSSSNHQWYPVATSSEIPSFQTIPYFNMLANIGARFESKPNLPIHNSKLSESFKYDNDKRMIEKSLPDEGITKFVYSEAGLEKFSQAEIQNANNQFSYRLYDKWDRLIEKGVYSNPVEGGYAPQGTPVVLTFSNTDPGSSSSLNVYNLRNDNTPLNTPQCSEQKYILYDEPASDFPLTNSLFTQKNLTGRVSKTWNINSSTWYGYDYEGKISFTVSQTSQLGTKTVRYVYNERNQPSLIAYDELGSNPFFVKYSYDADGLIIRVESSKYAQKNYEVIAEYDYNIHGKVISTNLGNKLQGLDYHYTIEGKLKSINNALDPSDDKDLLSLNTTFSDLFAEVLHYYEGDYENNNSSLYSISDQSLNDNHDLLPKGSTWYTHPSIALPHNLSSRTTYGFSYDRKGQLTEAKLGIVNNSNGIGAFVPHAGNKFKVTFEYDQNGNITDLTRRAHGSTNLIDNLTYHFEENTSQVQTSNRLTQITDNVSGTQFPDELQTQLTGNYVYDVSGRLIKDKQRDVSIAYNSDGQVIWVKNFAESHLRERNYYDENNFLIRKESYGQNGGLTKTQFWVNDGSGKSYQRYEELFNPSSQGILPKEGTIYSTGRLASIDLSASEAKYNYEIKDHIGNVRVAFDESLTPNNTFDFTSATLQGWTAFSDEEHYPSDEGVFLLGQTVGMHKDINFSDGRYKLNVTLSGNEIQPLKLIIKDSQNNLVKEEVIDAQNKKTMVFYLPNSDEYTVSVEGANAGYNDLVIEKIVINQSTLNVLKYADYYPFGWEMPGRTFLASGANNLHGYQGNDALKNAALQWNSFQLRNIDSRIGRWLTFDPANQYYSGYMAMGNNPINMVDPDGAWSFDISTDMFDNTFEIDEEGYIEEVDKTMYYREENGDITAVPFGEKYEGEGEPVDKIQSKSDPEKFKYVDKDIMPTEKTVVKSDYTLNTYVLYDEQKALTFFEAVAQLSKKAEWDITKTMVADVGKFTITTSHLPGKSHGLGLIDKQGSKIVFSYHSHPDNTGLHLDDVLSLRKLSRKNVNAIFKIYKAPTDSYTNDYNMFTLKR